MKKEEIIKRLTALQALLNMDAKDFAEQYNAEHADDWFKMDASSAYPYMVGWVRGEIENILTH